MRKVLLKTAFIAFIWLKSLYGDAGQALHFDGIDDYVTIPGSQHYEFEYRGFTIEMWLNCDQILEDTQILIANQTLYDFQLSLIPNVGDSAIVQFHCNGSLRIETNPTLWPLGQWIHLALTRSVDTLKILINGNESASDLYVGNCGDQTDINIGLKALTYSDPFKGTIDELRFWDITKAQDEIQESMNRHISGNETGLIGYWRFNEGVGDSVLDYSPYGNNGQLGPGDWWHYSYPSWIVSDAPIISNAWFVSPDGSDSIGIGTEQDPFASIQKGIYVSSNSDTVIVGDGVYTEHLNTSGKDIKISSVNGPEFSSIIGFTPDLPVISITSYESSNCVVDGFTIYHPSGNAFLLQNSAPKLLNNVFTEFNHDIIVMDNCSATIQGNYFAYNSARVCTGFVYQFVVRDNSFINTTALGIYEEIGATLEVTGNLFNNCKQMQFCDFVDLKISDNDFLNMFSVNGGSGGALNIYGCLALEIDHNNFINCTAEQGGAIWIRAVHGANIHHNLFAGNSSVIASSIAVYDVFGIDIYNNTICHNTDSNGAISFYHNHSLAFVYNNIIAFNDSYGIYRHLSSNPIFSDYNDVFDNSLGNYLYTEPGDNSMEIDPLFRDPENGDFHLMAIECGDPYDSPCIDMGKPTILDSLLDCDWGLGTIRSDMGAYSGGEDAVDIERQDQVLPKTISISQNYPNPFNTSTLIKYELPQQSHVTIEICDILGRHVGTLKDGLQPAGYHQVIWDAEDLSSGVYFYKLQAGDYIETRKMTLIK